MSRTSEIFWTFLRLGMIAFGGPVAHLGFYRHWFIEERQWLTDEGYAQLVALSQMLPGPASSQTSFAIGIHRGGLIGGVAAWVGFTLPSAVIMISLGVGVVWMGDFASSGWLQGLKLAAVAIVTHALYGMARQLCPDAQRLALAGIAAIGASLIPGALGQIGMIVMGAVIALRFFAPPAAASEGAIAVSIRRRTGIIALGLFAVLFIGLSIPWSGVSPLWSVLYRSGALVFGGGHVVLPLLETGLVGPGLIDGDRFLAGYGAAQAIPGPIFSFAGYLGTQVHPGDAITAGLLATTMIFAPGLLLVTGVLPFWHALSRYAAVRKALLGINAAVVGLLAAVLWDPILSSAMRGISDAVIALVALGALAGPRVPAYWIVAGCAIAGELATWLPL